MPAPPRHFYDFGSFRVDPDKHRLFRNNELVQLPPKSFETLLVLVQNPGQLLEREELLKTIWADAFVEDANLTVAVSNLRKALSQDNQGAYIETVPRVGYRFLADVRVVSAEPKPVIVEKHTLSRRVIEEEVTETPTTASHATLLRSIASNRVSQLAFVVGAVVLTLAGWFYFRGVEHRRAFASSVGSSQIKSIAVLPPRSLTDNESNSSFSLGITDALVTRLGGIRDLSVRPMSASARYIDSKQDPLEVGRALGVDAVLDGSLQREAGRVRITLRMLDVSNGHQIWSSNIDESDQDIFKLQDSISEQVAAELFGQLSVPEREHLARHQTHNSEAYAAYVQGMYYWNKRGDQTASALPFFRHAIDLDPNFAEAYVGLANIDATHSIPSPEAETLINRALQLDDRLSEAHATNALIKMFHHWDWQTAETELNKAIELNPASVSAHHWKGVFLSLNSRLEEAQAEMHFALSLDPTSPILLADIGQLHYLAGQFDQAIEYCNRAIALDPDSQFPQFYLFHSYAAKGMENEALKHLAMAESPHRTIDKRILDAYLRQGLAATLRSRLKKYLEMSNEDKAVNSLLIAQHYLLLRDDEEAMRWLERIPERPNFFDPYLAVDPLYGPVRSNPKFQAVLHRMRLS